MLVRTISQLINNSIGWKLISNNHDNETIVDYKAKNVNK